MAGKPIATIGSMHVCPMVSGLIPHVGGPVTGPGAPNVLINGKPAALMGDICVCAGGPDTIAQGEPTVLINGTPVATMGSMTVHGGSITVGELNVTVSSATPEKTAYTSLAELPRPRFKRIDMFTNRVKDAFTGSKNSSKLKEAKANQEKIAEEAKEHGFIADYDFSV